MANYINSSIFAVENQTKLQTFKNTVMYKAILKNTRGEVEDYRICETYHTAVKQCLEWQLQHEYDFYETEIEKI